MKSPGMGKEAYLFWLSGVKMSDKSLDESLAGKMGGKNVGTPRLPGFEGRFSIVLDHPFYYVRAAEICPQHLSMPD